MAIVTAISNQKGGVGKTTAAQLLGLGLAEAGYSVLLIDADPQANLSYNLGVSDPERTVADVFKGTCTAEQATCSTPHGVDLIAGSLDLAGADMEYTQLGRENILREALEPVKERYDFVLIDTPPALGILTYNALTAANDVLVAMETSTNALQGLGQLLDTVGSVRKYANSDLSILGIVLMRYNPRTNLARFITEQIREAAEVAGTELMESTVREAVAVREAATLQQNLYESYSGAAVTEDFRKLTQEYIRKEGL